MNRVHGMLMALGLSLSLYGCGAQGSGTKGDGRTAPPMIQGRNAQEFMIPGAQYHPQGIDLRAVVALPQGEGPFPGCVIVHGSGGVFVQKDPDEPCTEEVEKNFKQLKDLLVENGVAAILPDSFSSRGEKFCEDNSGLANAPPGYNREQHRIAIRTYDLLAATNYFCDLEQVDCSRLCFVGTSNGGSIIFHYLHQHLDKSFEAFFADPNQLSKIGNVPYMPIPADRPLPRFAQPISPGCGLNSAIGLEDDAGQLEKEDITQLYYPAADLFMDIGTNDSVPDDCAREVGQGRRQTQAEEVVRRLGISQSQSRYRFKIYQGGMHDLLGQTPFGDQIRASFLQRVNDYLKN